MRKKRISPTLSTPQGAKQSGPPVDAPADEERRRLLLQRLILVGIVFTVANILADIVDYSMSGPWQTLADGGYMLLSAVCLVVAGRFLWRGTARDYDTAGYWMLLATVVGIGGSESVWASNLVLSALGGGLLILVVASVTLPGRRRVRLVAVGLYVVYVLAIYRFEPLPRYDIGQSPVRVILNWGTAGLLLLIVVWQAISAYRQLTTIRTSLLISFVSSALLIVVTIGVTAVVVGMAGGRRQAISRLDLVVAFKATEVETWVHTLQSELGSVLVRANATLNVNLLLEAESPDSQVYQDAYDRLLEHFQQHIDITGLFDEIFLLDLGGHVVLSTDVTQDGKIYVNAPYFQRGLEGLYVHPPFYSPSLGRMSVIVAQPVVGQHGDVIGVLAGRAGMDALSRIMTERSGLGDTGETYLVGSNHVMLTASRFAEGEKIYIHTEGANAAIENHVSGSGLYEGYRSVPVIGVFRWLPDLQVVLIAEQEQREAFAPMYLMLGINGGVALLAVLLAVGASLFVTRSISIPLSELVETATQIAAGDLERLADVRRHDEIGALAQAFNQMTARLRQVIGELEQRVTDRTRELERRAVQLQASAEVSRAITSILDADQLSGQVVDLIRERFGLYYVGLFLVDEAGEWAVLRAGSGEAGRAMLARGHRLRVGQGMIGWSIANAQARVALEAGMDAVRQVIAELPDTRSEASLPLRSRGQVIGALSVQSDRPGVFDEATVAVLQTMADQVAVALDNARLFTTSQAALEAARTAYGEMSRKSWGKLLSARPDLVYRGDVRGVVKAEDIWRPEMERALQDGQPVQMPDPESGVNTLAMPIKVRGSVIGVLDTCKPGEAGAWTAEEIALLETLVDQLGVALESARLYEEARRRATRERLTSEITDRMRRAPDVEGIVQAAVDELFAVLGTSRAFVRLKAPAPAPDTETR